MNALYILPFCKLIWFLIHTLPMPPIISLILIIIFQQNRIFSLVDLLKQIKDFSLLNKMSLWTIGHRWLFQVRPLSLWSTTTSVNCIHDNKAFIGALADVPLPGCKSIAMATESVRWLRLLVQKAACSFARYTDGNLETEIDGYHCLAKGRISGVAYKVAAGQILAQTLFRNLNTMVFGHVIKTV